MTHRFGSALLAAQLVLMTGAAARAQDPAVRVVFVEPARVREVADSELYQLVSDTVRVRTYEGWMANESARMALALYAQAWALTARGRAGEPALYYVALVPGGNNGAVGLRMVSDAGAGVRARTSFIKLAPEDWAFSTTFLHETGHVILSMLNGGQVIPRQEIAAFSHSTAALTDRGTAFDEGFAIHLETLEAYFTTDAFLKDRYNHLRYRFGVSDGPGEYYRHARDLLSFSQTVARYHEVQENNFAFAPAYAGPDYLRVQLEKSRDFASLRNANQLLQSEGFYASFFFGLLMRGDSAPTPVVVRERQQKMLSALAALLAPGSRRADDPFLLLFVEEYGRLFPDEALPVIDVLLDLSHGVFVDRDAATLWRAHYLGALRLDLKERNNANIEAARAGWRAEAVRDPAVMYRTLGPQIRAEVVGPTVTLLAFGESQPVSFDANTVEEGVMRLIPGIGEPEIGTWLRARNAKAFADVVDFRHRGGLRPRTLARLRF